MNLVVIGNDTDDIALDIWKGNTNYTVLNQNPYLWGKNLLEYISNKDVIISTTADQFEVVEINDFLEYMHEHKFIPIFIADDEEDFVNKMYIAIHDILQDAVLFIRNEQNEGYTELIKIAREYLIKRNESDGKTIRTSRKRKTSSSKK